MKGSINPQFKQIAALIGLIVVVALITAITLNRPEPPQAQEQEVIVPAESAFVIPEDQASPPAQGVIPKKQAREYIYLASTGTDEIVVIDVKEQKISKRIDVGNNPTELDLIDNLLYVANTDGESISVIDITKDEVIDTIDLEFKPKDVKIVGEVLYVTDADHEVHVIHRTSKLTFSINVQQQPLFIAVDQKNQMLYVTSAQADKLSLISTVNNVFTGDIKTESFPTGIVVRPAGDFIYVANQNANSISVIATKTKSEVAVIPVNVAPQRMLMTSDGAYIYTTFVTSEVGVIGTKKEELLYTIPTSTAVESLAFSLDETKVYVTHAKGNALSIIDRATKKSIVTIDVQKTPHDLIVLKK